MFGVTNPFTPLHNGVNLTYNSVSVYLFIYLFIYLYTLFIQKFQFSIADLNEDLYKMT